MTAPALSSKQRAALRAAANGLAPVFQVGKGGIDAQVVAATEACIKKRELIKLKLLETSPVTAREAADTLAAQTGAQVVQVVGRAVVLFRKKSKDSAFEDMLKK